MVPAAAAVEDTDAAAVAAATAVVAMAAAPLSMAVLLRAAAIPWASRTSTLPSLTVADTPRRSRAMRLLLKVGR